MYKKDDNYLLSSLPWLNPIGIPLEFKGVVPPVDPIGGDKSRGRVSEQLRGDDGRSPGRGVTLLGPKRLGDQSSGAGREVTTIGGGDLLRGEGGVHLAHLGKFGRDVSETL